MEPGSALDPEITVNNEKICHRLESAKANIPSRDNG